MIEHELNAVGSLKTSEACFSAAKTTIPIRFQAAFGKLNPRHARHAFHFRHACQHARQFVHLFHFQRKAHAGF